VSAIGSKSSLEIGMEAGQAIGGQDPAAGARNLLLHCAEAERGESLLIVFEPEALGIYGAGLVETLSDAALELGLTVATREVAFSKTVQDLPPDLSEVLVAADHAVFFARIGDQLRFRAMPKGARPVVSYALDTAMLGSGFGTADYRAFKALKHAIDRMLAGASEIRVTCPLGTDFSGAAKLRPDAEPADTSVLRFPMSVFTPLASRDFSGRVAIARFLVGTGSNYYEPYGLPLNDVIFAEIGDGFIKGFSGAADEVERTKAHYAHVGGLFGIDPYAIHSWHAGIHPGCAYTMPAEANYERWSCGAFGNPRILHFHTCGDYAPGEICWNIVDATILVDGVALWDDGVFRPDRIDSGIEIMRRYPDVAQMFRSPRREIGI
jgi:hypothetical protein